MKKESKPDILKLIGPAAIWDPRTALDNKGAPREREQELRWRANFAKEQVMKHSVDRILTTHAGSLPRPSCSNWFEQK